MASITIFDVPDEPLIINKTQQQILYENLATETKLPKHHFDSLLELTNFIEKEAVPQSNLIPVLLKYLIRYCYPILATNAQPILATQKQDQSQPILTTQKQDQSQLINTTLHHSQPNITNFTLQNDIITPAFQDGRNVMIPANQQFTIQGLLIPSVVIRLTDPYVLTHQEHIDDKQLYSSGHYGLQNYTTAKFTAATTNVIHAAEFPLKAYYFDSQAELVIKSLIDYIQFMESFYAVTFPKINLDYQFITEFEATTNEYNKHILPESKLLNKLNNVQDAKFGQYYTYDILNSLTTHDLLHLYNTGQHVGITPDFEQKYKKKKDSLDYQHEYNKQLNSGYQTYNKIALLNRIAYEKYNTRYSDLTTKQQTIANLEYQRIMSIQDNVEIQSLLTKLKASFTDSEPTRLKDTLIKIRKALHDDEQKGKPVNSVISGVCPHILDYADELLKNFNKPYFSTHIRDLLITKYALPPDAGGYYCKICGSKLLDQDNLAAGFGSDAAQMEDHIQTIIWKEATYIISTNIRFLEPVPVKPIINSLVSGLRNVIATEESKLLRVKTGNANMNDMLNLYSSIYIYASLCAIMNTNPGKIVFARQSSKAVEPSKSQEQSEYIITKAENKEGNQTASGGSYTVSKHKKQRLSRKIAKYVKGGQIVLSSDHKKIEAQNVKNALILLLLSKETIISRTKTLNNQIVQTLFSQAYAWASRYTKPISISTEEQIIKMELDDDPIYQYNKYMYNLYAFTNNKPLPSKIDVEQNAPKPDLPAKRAQLVYESYLSIQDYVNSGVYKHTVIPLHVQMSDHRNKWAYLIDIEKEYIHQLRRNLVRPNWDTPLIQDSWALNKFYPSDISKYYCISGASKGELHQAGSFIYVNQGQLSSQDRLSDKGQAIGKTPVEQIELTKKDIIKYLETNDQEQLKKFKSMKLINERCGKCGKLIWDATSTETLETLFKTQDNQLAFYQYYEIRCPVDGLHDFQNDQCVKCGAKPNEKSDSYYAKYVKIFNAVQVEQQKISIESLKSLKEEVHYYPIEQKPHEYSLKNIAEWSKLLKQPYNVLVNLGLSEKVKYSDIQNSKINPSKDSTDSSRGLKLKNYILYIIRDLSATQNNSTGISLDNFIQEYPQYELGANYDNYLLDYLAKLILDIFAISAESADTYTNWIIEQERLFSKANYVNLKTTIMEVEEGSEEDVGISGDDWDRVADEFDDENISDIQDINNEGYDVENAADIWELE